MRSIVVVDDPADWPARLPGVEVVTAREYSTGSEWAGARGLRVVNLCRSYRYQSRGYYVSLLAAARRHRPFPDLMTVLDMKNRTLVRGADDELGELVQRSLGPLKGSRFVLSIYFGSNLAKRHERLARRLYELFPAPLLRVQLSRSSGRWHVTSMAPIPAREVPPEHHEFVLERLRAYLARPRRGRRSARYDLAVLVDPGEELAPSDGRALGRFARAAGEVGFAVQQIQKDDYGRLAEFDALFLRTTTWVDHYTFRFARRAEALGLVVIDDPETILRSTNKVFLHEALSLQGVPVPRTLILDRVDVEAVEREVGLPCVLKRPDGAFSQGVVRISDRGELAEEGRRMLADSDLLLAQEYLPTDFDWRIGVLAGAPLYACRYHMARGHWQIVSKGTNGGYRYGRVESVPLASVPPRIVRTAVRAAATVGGGLYGVDLKAIGRRVVVMEVNDNPNLDGGCEDRELGLELYRRIARVFLERLEGRPARLKT